MSSVSGEVEALAVGDGGSSRAPLRSDLKDDIAGGRGSAPAEGEPTFAIRVVRMDYGDLVIRCDNRWEAGFRARAAAKEPETVRWIESFEDGDVFYDLGANVGSYSLIAASRGIETFAFEPHDASFSHLVDNIRINELGGLIHPFQAGLSDRPGVTRMHEKEPLPGAAGHLFDTLDGKFVLACTLDQMVDEYGLPSPTHVKIDVDGHEFRAVRGGEKVLSGEAVKSVMVEIDQAYHDSAQAVHARLIGMGFRGVEFPHVGSVSNWRFAREESEWG